MLVRAEEHLEVGDKCRGKLLHGDVLHMVADIEELLQVLVNGLVLGKRALGFHACRHLFLVVLVVLIEHLHQCVAAVFQSEKGVLDLFRRDIVVTLHDLLMRVRINKQAVRFECRRAFASDTPTFGVPQLRIDGQLATELCLASVHRDTTHDGNCPVFLHYLPFEVENN